MNKNTNMAPDMGEVSVHNMEQCFVIVKICYSFFYVKIGSMQQHYLKLG